MNERGQALQTEPMLQLLVKQLNGEKFICFNVINLTI